VARDPLALGRGLEQDAGPRAAPEHLGEPRARGCDAALDELAAGGEDAELALALVEIETYRIRGGWPPGCALRR
jgi:hypothetical protein